MATTPKGIYYPNDYNEIADIPEDMKKMAESIEEVFEDTDSDLSDIKEEQTTQNNRLNSLEVDNTTNKSDILTNKQDINNIKTEQTTQNTNIQTNADNISALTSRVTETEEDINDIQEEQAEQNTAIENNTTNIETLQAENEKLKSIVAQMPQVEGQGTEVTLENTIEAQFTIFDVEGNSVQDGTPSPDNEVPIYSAGDNGSINEKILTRNFLPNVATSQVKNGIDFTIYDDGTVKANGTSTSYAVITIGNIELPKGNYILSGCPTGGGGSTYLLRTQNGVNISDVFDTGSGANISITEKSGSADIKLQISPNVTVNNLIFKPMIRLASVTDDTYVPHEEQTYSIYTQQPFRSNKDKTIKDKFVIKSDNKKYERHYIGSYVFTENETVYLLSSNDNGYLFQIAKNFPLDNYTTNYLNNYSLANSTSSSSDADIGSYIFNGTYRLRVPSSIATNVTEFKNWLKTANNTIDYPLAEPIDLLCTETQIQQLENLPSTYEEMTIINSEDETPAYLEVSGIYDLNKLITRTEVLESES